MVSAAKHAHDVDPVAAVHLSGMAARNTRPSRHLLQTPGALMASGTPYTDFFRFLDAHLRPQSYFEIGTHLGRSLKAFTCDAACVDPCFMLEVDVLSGRGRTLFYQMTSDAFFAAYDLRTIFPRGPDICFLDGMHRSEHLLRDLIHTERSCHPRSIILMHDCLPVNARMALRTHEPGDPSEGSWQHAWTGDVWKIVPLLRKHRPDLVVQVFDCAPTGLVAVTGLDPSSTVLADAYHDLLRELRELDLDAYGIQRLWDEPTVISATSLVANPEDLTLFLDIQ